MDLINIKRVEIQGDKDTVVFLYKYVERGHWGVLDKAIERACSDESKAKYFIVEIETQAGYGNKSEPISDLHWREISRQEITLEALQKMFNEPL
jgi:hypothetical protein